MTPIALHCTLLTFTRCGEGGSKQIKSQNSARKMPSPHRSKKKNPSKIFLPNLIRCLQNTNQSNNSSWGLALSFSLARMAPNHLKETSGLITRPSRLGSIAMSQSHLFSVHQPWRFLESKKVTSQLDSRG